MPPAVFVSILCPAEVMVLHLTGLASTVAPLSGAEGNLSTGLAMEMDSLWL